MTPKLFTAAVQYSPEFETFWKLYKAPKTASKSDAYKAFLQCRRYLPEIDLLLAETEAYNNHLMQESKKTGRDVPKLHASTFIRQGRYEGFEEDARAILAAKEANMADVLDTAQSWSGWPWERLREAANGEWEGVRQWASKATYIDSLPPEIMAPNSFVRDELERRYGKLIRKAFPQVQLTVKK